ncbi:MAG: lasso RiPP family leader peptide-containing protein [Gemmatimonadota bacterium]
MAEQELPNYEVPELLVYGTFRELTQLDWSMGIYPTVSSRRRRRRPHPPYGGCQVSGFGSSSCSSSS